MTNAPTAMGQETQFSCDLNAGFAFFLDVVVNLFVLSGLLIGAFNFPAEVVFGKIIPGAIVGILLGNIAMIYLAKKSAAKTGNENITALPMGLDLPTVFGMVFFVLGPVYMMNVETMGSAGAADLAWKIGMAGTFWIAIFKFILSYLGNIIHKGLPQMALVGAMACIATVWLGAEALLGVFSLPEVGILSLLIMIYSLTAGHKLPFALPGAVMAIFLSTGLYYILAFAGFGHGYVIVDAPEITMAMPMIYFSLFDVMFGEALNYIGLLLPFALLIAASGINVVAGAKMIGDDYDPSIVVRIDSITTAISALFGGVVQTTPYFGHPTYKRMGAKLNYAIGAVTIITLGGFLGLIAFASQMIPGAVLKPILTVVACDIVRLAVIGCDPKHAPSLLFSIVPGILNYTHSKVTELLGNVERGLQTMEIKITNVVGADWFMNYALLGAMSRSYVLTSMMWATFVIWIIDDKKMQAAAVAFACALFTLFGVIHSVLPSSAMYLPWNLAEMGGAEILPFRIASGYAIAGVILLLFQIDRSPAIAKQSV